VAASEPGTITGAGGAASASGRGGALGPPSSNLVALELDLCWIVNSSHDPLAYFERNSGRFHVWHVKDLRAEGEMADYL